MLTVKKKKKFPYADGIHKAAVVKWYDCYIVNSRSRVRIPAGAFITVTPPPV